MSSRPPSETLVIDANILISAVLGRVGPELIRRIGTSRILLTTAEAQREARRVLGDPRLRRPVPDPLAELTLGIAPAQPNEYFDDKLDDAARYLTEAAASANGSASDRHIPALAWAADADIWSHDRDFAGTGWPSWSTRNLRRALGL